ncbi:hypothetical protein BsWGS_05542 [Bradybaena similaris]
MSQMPGLPGIVVQLLVLLTAQSRANHNRWWSCGSECSRCVRMVTSMEELIVQFYPGLFSQAPPGNIILSPETPSNISSTVNSGQAKIPETGRSEPSNNFSSSVLSPAIWDFSTNGSRRHHHQSVSPGCCETEIEYATPTNFTVRGQVYQVVHLKNAFQFIPVGRCKEGSTCNYGECKEQYRAHWVLIYNATEASMGPPVSFSAIEVPSHCECINLSRSAT